MKEIKNCYSIDFSEMVKIGEYHDIDIRGMNRDRAKKTLMKGIEEVLYDSKVFLYEGGERNSILEIEQLHNFARRPEWLNWPSGKIKEARCLARTNYVKVKQKGSSEYSRFVLRVRKLHEDIEKLPWRTDSLRRFDDSEVLDVDRNACRNELLKVFKWICKKRIPGMDQYEYKEWVYFLGSKKIALDFGQVDNNQILYDLREWAEQTAETTSLAA